MEDKSRKSLFLIFIGDRAEKIRQQFEDRQIEATEALAKLEEIAKERIQAERERENLQIDENTYAIYTQNCLIV
ncbi:MULTISPECIES: hypothetical protein [Nostocales]|uniref:Uncharacterized protein n=1 Tax=Dolichospermum flos-aquae UHCC 0037 TaxID=2590026 RepID=A0ACC7S478_DOLFA|nr:MULTISPECIES: hypothetical protein [Nostocales]MBO1064479.1 hypothetical protein [Anabaena sp. 54]MTJ43328.1 hypothetical protein [Dolichospermum flos-aquae UHCC 0037]OBQ21682.1 MAG: hypothetical protein AN486_04035 [Anabaena sp. AL93]